MKDLCRDSIEVNDIRKPTTAGPSLRYKYKFNRDGPLKITRVAEEVAPLDQSREERRLTETDALFKLSGDQYKAFG